MKAWTFKTSQSCSDEERDEAGRRGAQRSAVGECTGRDPPCCKDGVSEAQRGQSLWGPFGSLPHALPLPGPRGSLTLPGAG